MFQYTTETIINSNVGRLVGGKRFDIIASDGSSRVYDSNGDVKGSITGVVDSDMLMIDGVNAFKVEFIKKIYRTGYRDSKKAKATLDLGAKATTLSAAKVLRLTATLREQGSVRSTIQNAYLHKSKPFHYELEFASTATNEDVIDAFVKLISKDMAMTDFAYFKASKDVSNASHAKLILTADDCYIQFVDVKLEEVLEIENPNTPIAAKLLGYNVVATPALGSVTIVPGDEGQGTVARLVKNLRIPTGASINPFAADQGGKPVPGGKYDQFLIEYVTDRHHVSGTVVGSVGEKSLTSHVLFIESAILADVVKILTAAGKNSSGITPAGRLADDNTTVGANLVTAADVSGNSELAPVGALKEKSEMGSVE